MRKCIGATHGGVALLLVLFLVVAVGCGSPAKSEEPAPGQDAKTPAPPGETGTSGDGADLELGNWLAITTIRSIVTHFGRLEWSWSTLEDGVEEEVATIVYAYNGSETLGSATVDKITLTINEEEWTVWVDANGNPQQLASGSEVLPGAMGQTMARAMMTMVLAPFSVAQVVPVRDVVRGTTPGWSFSEVARNSESFGDLVAEVTLLEITGRAPAVAEGSQLTVLLGIADFGDFQMLTEWRAVDHSDSEQAILMKVKRVERR